MTITVESMRDKLLPLSDVREQLAQWEPLEEMPFTVGSQVRFDVGSAWEFGLDAKELSDLVDAWITVGGGRGKVQLQMTKEALLHCTSFAGMHHKFAIQQPAQLLAPFLNYWYREGMIEKSKVGHGKRDFKILRAGKTAVACTPQTVMPFSNLKLLDRVLDGVRSKYGDVEVLVDPKFSHSLWQTYLRLVIPEVARTITDTSVDDDEWSAGVLLKNSLNGRGKTSVEGYLFRWSCSNGAIDVRNPAGAVFARGRGGGDVRKAKVFDHVYDWAYETTTGIFEHIEASFDAVQAMTDVHLHGAVADVLRDVFALYRVRAKDRPKIIDVLSRVDRLTMYEVMQAITQVANDPANIPAFVESLQRTGGEMPFASAELCQSCRRIAH